MKFIGSTMPLFLLKHNKITAQEAGFSLAGFLGILCNLTVFDAHGEPDPVLIRVDLQLISAV